MSLQLADQSSVLILLGASIALYFLVPRLWAIFRNAFSPLNKIPGRWRDKLSEWPFVLAITQGQSHQLMDRLHTSHGPIVVLAPKMIAVSDAKEIRRIIVTEDWPKSKAIYGNFAQNPDRPTLLAHTDKKAYGIRKRMMSSMFGIRSIRSMEPIMKDCITVALEKVNGECAGRKAAIIDIHRLIRSLAVDIIGATVFGQSFEVVKNGSHPLPIKIEHSLLMSGIFQFLPWLKGMPGFPTRDPYIETFTQEIVDKRRSVLGKDSKDDLLEKLVRLVDDNPESSFRTSDLQDEVVVLLTAGSETTANAEIFTLMLLARHPEKLEKLRQEIDSVYPDISKETTAELSAQMPYLQACFDETMRLYAAMASGSPRETTADTTILGFHVPKGTTVFPTTASLHLNGQVWEKPEQYIPERWLSLPADRKPSDLPFYPFSAGSRVCIGKHFAMQEMYLTIVTFLRYFDIEYITGQDESTVFRIALQLQAGKYMMKVTPRRF